MKVVAKIILACVLFDALFAVFMGRCPISGTICGIMFHVEPRSPTARFLKKFGWRVEEEYPRSYQTKLRMMDIKEALIRFRDELGSYPFIGTAPVQIAFDTAGTACLSDSAEKNVLYTMTVPAPYERLGMGTSTYAEKWKGPYLVDTPDEVMKDVWNTVIAYRLHNSTLYLHSAGPDQHFDSIASAASASYGGGEGQDDIILHVDRYVRVKQP